MTVLLENQYVQCSIAVSTDCSIAVSTDCSIREYRSIFMELSSIVCNIPLNMPALCWKSTPAYYALYYAGIFDAGPKQELARGGAHSGLNVGIV